MGLPLSGANSTTAVQAMAGDQVKNGCVLTQRSQSKSLRKSNSGLSSASGASSRRAEVDNPLVGDVYLPLRGSSSIGDRDRDGAKYGSTSTSVTTARSFLQREEEMEMRSTPMGEMVSNIRRTTEVMEQEMTTTSSNIKSRSNIVMELHQETSSACLARMDHVARMDQIFTTIDGEALDVAIALLVREYENELRSKLSEDGEKSKDGASSWKKWTNWMSGDGGGGLLNRYLFGDQPDPFPVGNHGGDNSDDDSLVDLLLRL